MGDTSVEDSNPVEGKKLNDDAESQLQALEEKARKAQEAFEREEKLRKELEEQNTKLTTERNALQRQLDGEKGSLSEYMEKSLKLAAQKADLESQLSVSFPLFVQLDLSRYNPKEQKKKKKKKKRKKEEWKLEFFNVKSFARLF